MADSDFCISLLKEVSAILAGPNVITALVENGAVL